MRRTIHVGCKRTKSLQENWSIVGEQYAYPLNLLQLCLSKISHESLKYTLVALHTRVLVLVRKLTAKTQRRVSTRYTKILPFYFLHLSTGRKLMVLSSVRNSQLKGVFYCDDFKELFFFLLHFSIVKMSRVDRGQLSLGQVVTMALLRKEFTRAQHRSHI